MIYCSCVNAYIKKTAVAIPAVDANTVDIVFEVECAASHSWLSGNYGSSIYPKNPKKGVEKIQEV